MVTALKRFLFVFVIARFSCSFLSPLFAADIKKPGDFPSRRIEFNIMYGAGGGTDIFARTISACAAELIKPTQPIVIVNMPGAAGVSSMVYTMEQPADGYCIVAIGNDFAIIDALQRAEYQGRKLTIDDFEPVICCQMDTGAIQVNSEKSKFKGAPYKDLDDFIKTAKENPDQLIIGITGSAGYDEVATNLFFKEAGIKTKIIPYDAAGQMHAALLGNHIDAMYEEPGPTISLLEKGSLKMIVVFSDNRIEGKFNDVPTSVEKGINTTLGRWRGIGVKKGTPPEIIQYLHDIYKAAMDNPTYVKWVESTLGNLRPGYIGPVELKKFMKEEKDMFVEVFTELGHIKK